MAAERPSIVVVDDAADVRTLVAMTLELSHRFEIVGQASNGVEAIAAAKRFHPQVMLLDVSMPVMDGLEALPRVLEVSPKTRVIMYSGFDNQGLADRAKKLGATAFLEKSASVRQLPGDVADLLRADDSNVASKISPAATSGDARPPTAAVTGAVASADDLEQHRERFREVFEEAVIGLGAMTLTGRLVRANRALAQLAGRPAPALVGVLYAELATGLSAQHFDQILADFAAGADLARFEHTVHVEGQSRRWSAAISAVRDKHKRLLYLSLQVQDITAQRRLEDELRLSEERFRLLVDGVTDYAIFMLDPDGIVRSWNAGAERTKDYRADQIIGQHFSVFYPADKQAAQHPAYELQRARRDGRYEDEGWRVRRDGTHFWANVVITPVRNNVGELIGFVKITRDESSRRAVAIERETAAHALSESNAKLKHSNARLATAAANQAQLVAITIHELRSPLKVITGAAEMLVSAAAELTAEQQASMVTTMRSSAGRLNRLLADLLTGSRLESRAMDIASEPVDIAALLNQVAIETAQMWPQHPLTVTSQPGLIVNGDRDRLGQAVDNLVGNALRHGTAPIELSATGEKDAVEVRVRDYGPGIPLELRTRLFERFATGREAGGTGLGLFIVRELARAHGGDAWYAPTTENGVAVSCFVISIPREIDPTQP